MPAGGSPAWPWAAGALLLIALAAVALLRRRRRALAAPGNISIGIAPPPPAPPPEKLARPHLALDFTPKRGGLNMLSATVEGELSVRNVGDAPAERVRIEATLLAARSGQEAELGALFSRAVERSVAPPFDLAPGEGRTVRIVAALPLGAAEPLVVAGRAMLVPVLAANAVFHWPDGEGQAAAAYIVGVAREGRDKLAPFWLDAPRMHDNLAVRAHGFAVER